MATTILIRLEVEGPEAAVSEAVDATLDAGDLQDAINGYGHDDGEVSVTSATVLYGPPQPRELTLEDVTVTLTAEEEEQDVVNHFCTDEPERDREQEREIMRRIASGDRWAWFCAKVEVEWNGMVGTDYLGCCSYGSEEDFRQGDYYQDMVQEALGDLNRQIRDAWSKIAPLTA